MRSESEKSFDECQMKRARLQSLGLAYLSPQNKSLAQSFRYMRHKPTIIAFKTPSLENYEAKINALANQVRHISDFWTSEVLAEQTNEFCLKCQSEFECGKSSWRRPNEWQECGHQYDTIWNQLSRGKTPGGRFMLYSYFNRMISASMFEFNPTPFHHSHPKIYCQVNRRL